MFFVESLYPVWHALLYKFAAFQLTKALSFALLNLIEHDWGKACNIKGESSPRLLIVVLWNRRNAKPFSNGNHTVVHVFDAYARTVQ